MKQIIKNVNQQIIKNVNQILDRVDVIFPIIMLIFGILILCMGFKLASSGLKQVSIFLIAAPVTYLIFRKKFSMTKESLLTYGNSKKAFLLLSITFFFLMIISAIIISQNIYSRPLSFLIVMAIMAGVIAVQIALTNNKSYHYFVLFEIIVLGILIRASVYYQFTGLIGGDPWAHMTSIQSLIDMGHITEKGMPSYYLFPLMHIFATDTCLLTSLNIKDSMFILGLSEMLVVVFLFLIVKHFFDTKIGLLSTLLLSVVCVHYIQYAFLIIPQTLGIVFLVILIYLMLYQKNMNSFYKKLIYSVFIVLIVIETVLTHTIASFAALLTITSIFIVDVFKNKISETLGLDLEKMNYVSITIILFFGVVLIYYWMNSSGFLGYIGESIRWGFSVTYQAPSVSTIEESFTVTFMKMLPLYFLVFFATIGFFYSLNTKYFKTINLYGWLILFLVYIATFLGLNSILPARWFVFVEIGLIVPLTIAVSALSEISSKKTIMIFLIVFMLSFVSLTNYEANALNVNPLSPYPTQGMKYSEINIGIFDKIPSNMNIYTDLGYHIPNLTGIAEDSSFILSGKNKLNGIILIRKDLYYNPYFTSALGGGQYSITRLDPLVLDKIEKENRIYDSGTVTAFEGGV